MRDKSSRNREWKTMKAMILAAGLGTRLRPLTNTIPKALAPVNGCPAIERVIEQLKKNDVTEIIINLHYKGQLIKDFIESKNNFDIKIEYSDETEELLDTGGGLKKASWFFNDNQPFYLINSDIMSNLSLKDVLNYHNGKKAVTTLIGRPEDSKRKLLVDENMRFSGLTATDKSPAKIFKCENDNLKEFTFAGIHVISPEIFKYFQDEKVFSIIDTYLLAGLKESIYIYEDNDSFWIDIGTPEQLEKANIYYKD